MRQLSQRFERLLEAVQRVRFFDLLLEATYGIRTWLLAAVGALAMVYFAALARREWSVTELLLAALAAGIVVAAFAAALTFVWMLLWAIYAEQRRSVADIAVPESSLPDATSAADGHPPGAAETQPVLRPAGPVSPPPPRKKVYSASELQSRVSALTELFEQLNGPVQDAYDFGHAMAARIGEACSNNTRQEIIGRLDIFKSFTEASLKDLTAIVRRHSFEEIERMGPWDYGQVIDKTGILALLMPLVPEHILREDNFSAPALRQAGAEWMRAVDGFGAWISERNQQIAAQFIEYESADVHQ